MYFFFALLFYALARWVLKQGVNDANARPWDRERKPPRLGRKS